MKPQVYLILIIIFYLLPDHCSAQYSKNTVVFIADSFQTDNEGICFRCNSFVTDAFTPGFKLKSLLKNKNDFFNISIQPTINLHDSAVVDTAFYFSNRKNEIYIYKATNTELINRFDLTDRRFVLKGPISIGMTKENFRTKFSIKSLKNDTIIICDDDNIVRFTFYFRKNALVRMTYKALID